MASARTKLPRRRRVKSRLYDHAPSDSGKDLLQRLRGDLSGIMGAKANSRRKPLQGEDYDKLLAGLNKRREECMKKEFELSRKLQTAMATRLEHVEVSIRKMTKIVAISSRPGLINYPKPNAESFHDIREITKELGSLQAEIKDINAEAERMKKERRLENSRRTEGLDRHLQRIIDKDTGRTSEFKNTEIKSRYLAKTQIRTLREWHAQHKPSGHR
ncbi:hypothetical protein AAMO2058_001614600 [Amorphochlora amoebiformis]